MEKRRLKPWLRNRPYLWRIVGFTAFIIIVPLCFFAEFGEYFRNVMEAISKNTDDCLDLMKGNVKK